MAETIIRHNLVDVRVGRPVYTQQTAARTSELETEAAEQLGTGSAQSLSPLVHKTSCMSMKSKFI